MERYEEEVLSWISNQKRPMLDKTIEWSSINTGTFNLVGLEKQCQLLKKELHSLGAQVEQHPLKPHSRLNSAGERWDQPLGNALVATMRPEAPKQVILSGHMDTVFGAEHPFQAVTVIDEQRVRGPGIIDLKGGLVVLLTALRALEKYNSPLGWTVVISPDEEIGSPQSAELLTNLAKGQDLALVFEPPFPDGAFVSSRRSSSYYTITAQGRAAHVGRHYAEGRSALRAIAQLVEPIEKLNSDDVIVNVGCIEGGGPSNVVPDFAMLRMNIRARTESALQEANRALAQLISDANGEIAILLHPGQYRAPKPFDKTTQELFHFVKECASELGVDATWRESGGVCDGNVLAAAGLPTIDTMGPYGGNIHTDKEYLMVDSLVERTQLATLVLLRHATGRFQPHKPSEKQ